MGIRALVLVRLVVIPDPRPTDGVVCPGSPVSSCHSDSCSGDSGPDDLPDRFIGYSSCRELSM